MQSERATRRALVRVAIWLTAGTPLAPTRSERKLLAQFLQGNISLRQLSAFADGARQAEQAVVG